MDKVGVEMSEDCNLIAGTEVSSSMKAAINVIHEIDEEHFEEPEIIKAQLIDVSGINAQTISMDGHNAVAAQNIEIKPIPIS